MRGWVFCRCLLRFGHCLTVGLALSTSPTADGAEMGVSEVLQTAAPGAEFFAATSVWHFRLDIDALGMKSLRNEPREWAQGTLRMGDGVFTNVALHIKGSEGSLQPIDARPSLTVSINKYAPGRKLRGLRKIHFNNTAEDPSFMTEILCGELCRQAGVPAARSGYATLTLNGRKLGLYVLKEGLTKEFLAQHFKKTGGNLYDGGFRKDIDQELERIGGEGPEDQSDRLALLAAAREPDPVRRWTRLQKVLDTDRFLSLLALSTITWNWDGYPMSRNNYRLYHDPETDKLVFIPHGLDQMFWEPQGTIYPRSVGIVASAVLRLPEGRRLYRERLASVHTNVFNAAAMVIRIDRLASVIRPYKADVDVQATKLKRLITGRHQSITQQLGIPDAKALTFSGEVASLTGWSKVTAVAAATMDDLRVDSGQRVLRIRHPHPATSAWKKSVLLPTGTYEFVARVKVPRIEIEATDRFAGVGLRASAPSRLTSRRIQTVSDWQDARWQFTVTGGEQTVDLACEFRSASGEVWFDHDSLKIKRVTPSTLDSLREWLRR